MVCQVSQVTSMLEDRAGEMWVGVDGGLYLFKDGRFRRLARAQITSRLDLVVGMAEDIEGKYMGRECAGNPGTACAHS